MNKGGLPLFRPHGSMGSIMPSGDLSGLPMASPLLSPPLGSLPPLSLSLFFSHKGGRSPGGLSEPPPASAGHPEPFPLLPFPPLRLPIFSFPSLCFHQHFESNARTASIDCRYGSACPNLGSGWFGILCKDI